MQHDIGDHALLADSRTAALIDPEGNVAWMCWPRVDSPPLLFSILDETRGGCFSVRPAAPLGRPTRAYHASTLVLQTRWAVAGGTLIAEDALLLRSGPALVRRVRAEGCEVEVEVRFGCAGRLLAQANTLDVAARTRLHLVSAAPWTVSEGSAVSRFTVAAGEEFAVILAAPGSANVADIDGDISTWRRHSSGAARLTPSTLAAASSDVMAIRDTAATSICVILGLAQHGGGIVAAPTTSLPQWPGSGRTWDYRFCWMRDAALAGVALTHVGQVEAAHTLGDFLGGAVMEHGVRPVYRVDGGLPAEEAKQPRLAGYRGARPVRFGNAAAAQAQLDAPAELMELVWALAAHGHVPSALAAAATMCADWIADHWREPDHGIWEIRGPARHYTHSRAMACMALRGAADLSARGVLRGNDSAWRGAADAVGREIRPAASGALELHRDGGGADAALALVSHVGFLPAEDPLNVRTLQLLRERLDRNGLLERYEGTPDAIPDPCHPFVFPTFWMAEAAAAAGMDGARHLRAAFATRGALNLFGEVANPGDHSAQGNYPQVQSHAAFLIASTEGVATGK
ncbi:MAG: glycoside hydrolase family 15 protein [Candidatus Dormibacteraeota bacterium]|nr:glycoside hydrolase family 15 protein [Candidatus Dormibacteraeota bacterium]MBV9524357.1 glycoside hydrolase family 15 protein [Candidatus Dormibacteraeota bacterium]